jgi:hypothetical protein
MRITEGNWWFSFFEYFVNHNQMADYFSLPAEQEVRLVKMAAQEKDIRV